MRIHDEARAACDGQPAPSLEEIAAGRGMVSQKAETLRANPGWAYLVTGEPQPPAGEPSAPQGPVAEQPGPQPLPKRTPKRRRQPVEVHVPEEQAS